MEEDILTKNQEYTKDVKIFQWMKTLVRCSCMYLSSQHSYNEVGGESSGGTQASYDVVHSQAEASAKWKQ